MIKEAYVSFEVARLLKDKGFEVPFFFYYRTDDEVKNIHHAPVAKPLSYYQKYIDGEVVAAPTHQMAMKWLRERQIDIVVFHERLPEDCYWARIEKYPYTEHQQEPIYQTYEEAVEAALKYTLENLI